MQQRRGPRTRRGRWSCRTTGAVESLRLPRERPPRPSQDAFKETVTRRDGRERRGSQLARADAALLGERHHLDGLVPGSRRRRCSRTRGSRGSTSRRREFVTTDDLVDPSSLAAIWQRIQGASTGGTPTRPARQRDRLCEGSAERPAPLDHDRDDDQGHGRARLRGRRRGHGGEPGGAASKSL